MKKITKVLLILLIAFVFIPVVHAKDLPKSGTTYFLTYPNGREDATESYDEAINPSEKLIYTGTTNNKEETSVYIVYDDETETLRFSPIIPKVSREAVDIPSETLNLPNQPVMNSGSKNKPTLMPLTKVDNVEIVRNGVTILTLSASDFEEIGEHQELSVTNQNKAQALINYFEDIDEEKCSFLFPKSTTLTPEAGK